MPAEQVMEDIRQVTLRHFSAEDKIGIVVEGPRGEDSIAKRRPFRLVARKLNSASCKVNCHKAQLSSFSNRSSR